MVHVIIYIIGKKYMFAAVVYYLRAYKHTDFQGPTTIVHSIQTEKM
jgi:hypothetical protein